MQALHSDQHCGWDHTSLLLFRQEERSLHKEEQLLILWNSNIVGCPWNSWNFALPSWCFWLERVHPWTLFRQAVADRFDLTWLAQRHTGSLWTAKIIDLKWLTYWLMVQNNLFCLCERCGNPVGFPIFLGFVLLKTYLVASRMCGSLLILVFVSNVIN